MTTRKVSNESIDSPTIRFTGWPDGQPQQSRTVPPITTDSGATSRYRTKVTDTQRIRRSVKRMERVDGDSAGSVHELRARISNHRRPRTKYYVDRVTNVREHWGAST